MACNTESVNIGGHLVEWTVTYGDESTGWYSTTAGVRMEPLVSGCTTREECVTKTRALFEKRLTGTYEPGKV